jgi:hypothetical protein
VIVASIGSNGTSIWSDQYNGASAGDEAMGFLAAFEPNGALVLSGTFGSSVNLGAGPILGSGTFVGEFASKAPLMDAKLIWGKGYNGKIPPSTLALAPRKGTSMKDIVIGGRLDGSAEFGLSKKLGGSGFSGFVMKVAP